MSLVLIIIGLIMMVKIEFLLKIDELIEADFFSGDYQGLQPWYSRRKKHGLRSVNSNELLKTEEGIACIHTLVNANIKFLFLPALLYCECFFLYSRKDGHFKHG
jgi:hypothetical protein